MATIQVCVCVCVCVNIIIVHIINSSWEFSFVWKGKGKIFFSDWIYNWNICFWNIGAHDKQGKRTHTHTQDEYSNVQQKHEKI